MPRLKIIILETEPSRINYAFWADVPATRQRFYADAAKVSVWKDATAADNTALQNGSVTELVHHLDIAAEVIDADRRAALRRDWQAFQARINDYNPWSKYGTTYDTAWTVGGVA